jgi:hypothetical protein
MPVHPKGCNAVAPSVYQIGISANGEPIYGCRCVVCGRCKNHTGNSHQGHYWKYCKVTNTMREFHFCCPEDCELENG